MITRTVPKTTPLRSRLLYVEENAESVALMEQLLAGRNDLQLMCAADVNLAIKLSRSKRPEVILVNIDLPGVTELGAVRLMTLLRADPGTQTAPIVALSANADAAAVVKGLEAGFFHYLTMPLKAGPFMEALAYALEFAALERTEQADAHLRGRPQPLKEPK